MPRAEARSPVSGPAGLSSSWRTLEFRHLAAFVAIGHGASFTSAADLLGYSQSAISHQISSLEAIVGQQLVERRGGPRPASLTAAGLMFLPHAEALLTRATTAEAEIESLFAGDRGTLRLGCYSSAGRTILPRTMTRFRALWPNIDVELSESPDDGELLRLLGDGALDMTFVTYPLEDGPFAAVELLEDPYVLVVHPDSPIAQRQEIPTLDEISELPLIGYKSIRRAHWMESRLAGSSVECHVILRSNDNGTILGMAEAGLAVAVIPWTCVVPTPEQVRLIPLPQIAPRIVALAWRADAPPEAAGQCFLAVAKEVCAELRVQLDADAAHRSGAVSRRPTEADRG